MRLLVLLLTVVYFVRARWRWSHLRGRALRRYQERRARRIVGYTLRHSPFYRRHWAGHDPRRWRTLPTVDKRLMMDNFERFNTRGIGLQEAMSVALQAERSRDFTPTARGFTVGLSSGTSGHRGLFLASLWEQAAWAGTILARTLHTLRPRRLRVAFFLRSNSNLYEQVGGILIRFRFFDLMMPLGEAIDRLNAFQPHIVVGPPSLLAMLAGRVERNAGGGPALTIRPERLVSVAEVLEPQDKKRLEMVFGAPVHQIYQCTEGFLAASCAHGSLHIQEDIVVIHLERLPGGDAARYTPVVTDLWRTTQPIICYRLNDVLEMESVPCPCGSTFRVIRAIEGRCDDICLFESRAGGMRPFFPDTIRRMVLLASPDILDYQAVQEHCGQLRIRLALPPGADFERVSALVRDSVQATMAQYGCLPADIVIEEGLQPQPAGAKRRRVVRLTVIGGV